MLDIELLDLTPTPLPQHPLDTLLQKSKMVQEKKNKTCHAVGRKMAPAPLSGEKKHQNVHAANWELGQTDVILVNFWCWSPFHS